MVVQKCLIGKTLCGVNIAIFAQVQSSVLFDFCRKIEAAENSILRRFLKNCYCEMPVKWSLIVIR